jgi:hypothetical protein
VAARVALTADRAALAETSIPKLCRFFLFDDATLDAYRRAADKLDG